MKNKKRNSLLRPRKNKRFFKVLALTLAICVSPIYSLEPVFADPETPAEETSEDDEEFKDDLKLKWSEYSTMDYVNYLADQKKGASSAWNPTTKKYDRTSAIYRNNVVAARVHWDLAMGHDVQQFYQAYRGAGAAGPLGAAAVQYAFDKVGMQYDQDHREYWGPRGGSPSWHVFGTDMQGRPVGSRPASSMVGVYDCSSLAYRSYACASAYSWGGGAGTVEGATASPTAADECQWIESMGYTVSVDQLAPGDVLFFSGEINGRWRNISHVAIYAGEVNGVKMQLAASGDDAGVVYQPMSSGIIVAGRPYKVEAPANTVNAADWKELLKKYPHAKEQSGYTLTFYCPCAECCGIKSDPADIGRTRTEEIAEPNHTIAVDPADIPLGKHVILSNKKDANGNYIIYKAQDTGSHIDGRRIDVYMSSHQEAKNAGVETDVTALIID